MTTKTSAASTIDMEKYRLRSFVERLIDMGEVEIHDQLVPLAGLGAVIEGTQKAVLFKKTGPEHAEMVAKSAGNRRLRVPSSRRCWWSGSSPAWGEKSRNWIVSY